MRNQIQHARSVLGAARLFKGRETRRSDRSGALFLYKLMHPYAHQTINRPTPGPNPSLEAVGVNAGLVLGHGHTILAESGSVVPETHPSAHAIAHHDFDLPAMLGEPEPLL